MGKGGEHKSVPSWLATRSSTNWVSPYNPLDPKAPKLPTKGEIKAIIPKECFERSYIKSLSWIMFDLSLAALLAVTAKASLSTNTPLIYFSSEGLLWLLGWNLYAFCMGSTMTALWVLGHEAGHGALFPSAAWNDCFGFAIHQALLTPYFSWRYTHAKHHQYTNNLHKDTGGHIPRSKETQLAVGKEGDGKLLDPFPLLLHQSILARVFGNAGKLLGSACSMLFSLFLWFPLYLFGFMPVCRTNYDGSPNKGEFQDFFNPNSAILPPKLRSKVALSTVTFIAAMGLLTSLVLDNGFLSVFLWYGFPLLWGFFWSFTYTFLHHKDPSIPFYGNNTWTWMKGALTSVDRDYGVFNFFHHQIGHTHLCHHLFHEIPFYNSVKATEAFKQCLEPKGLYNFDPTPWPVALWRTFVQCQYVDDTNGIQYEKSFW